MELFLERFLIPVAAGLVVFLITKQAPLSAGWRAAAVVGVAMAAFLVASVAERLQSLPVNAPSPPLAEAPRAATKANRDEEDPGKSGRRTLSGHVETGDSRPANTVRQDRIVVTDGDAFLRKYLVKDPAGRSGAPRWAVLIAGRDTSDAPGLSSAVGDVLSERGYERVSVFRPAVVQDRKYEEIYAADPLLSRKLRQYCEGIIVGKVSSSAARKDTTLDGLLSVEMSVDIRVITTQSGHVKNEFRINDNGAGFTSMDAQSRAEERLATKLRDRLRTILE